MKRVAAKAQARDEPSPHVMTTPALSSSWRIERISPRFVATDREATIRFYGLLGFALTYDEEGFLILSRDDVDIHVNVYEDGGYCAACWIGVANIRQLYRACEHAGVVASPLEEKPYGLTEFAVRDPHGNYILLAEPTAKPPPT